MGINADGLGNHNFDKGQEYLRKTLIPIASKAPAKGETSFVFLSANMVDGAGKTPPEWAPYHVYTRGGVKIGLVGFSNEDIPELTNPKALAPYKPSDAAKAVAATASMLREAHPAALDDDRLTLEFPASAAFQGPRPRIYGRATAAATKSRGFADHDRMLGECRVERLRLDLRPRQAVEDRTRQRHRGHPGGRGRPARWSRLERADRDSCSGRPHDPGACRRASALRSRAT